VARLVSSRHSAVGGARLELKCSGQAELLGLWATVSPVRSRVRGSEAKVWGGARALGAVLSFGTWCGAAWPGGVGVCVLWQHAPTSLEMAVRWWRSGAGAAVQCSRQSPKGLCVGLSWHSSVGGATSLGTEVHAFIPRRRAWFGQRQRVVRPCHSPFHDCRVLSQGRPTRPSALISSAFRSGAWACRVVQGQ
jgi:hypothetical protein